MKAILCLLGFHKYDKTPGCVFSNQCVRCGYCRDGCGEEEEEEA